MSPGTKQLRDELTKARKADHEAQRAELAKWRENGQHPSRRPYPWRPHERTAVVQGVRVPAEPLIKWLKTFIGDPELAIADTEFWGQPALCFKIGKATMTLIKVVKLSDRLSNQAIQTLIRARYSTPSKPYPVHNPSVQGELTRNGYCKKHWSSVSITDKGRDALEQDAWQ